MRIPDVWSILPNGRPSAVTLTAAGLLSLSAGIVAGLLVFNGGPETAQPAVVNAASTTPALTATPTSTPGSQQTITPATDPDVKPGNKDKTKPEDGVTESVTPVQETRTKKAASSSTTTTSKPKSAATTAKPFLIKNAGSGLCVDLPGYGAVTTVVFVTQYTCHPADADNQEYTMTNSGGGSFMLQNVMGGLCLDVGEFEARAPGAEILTFSCDGVPAEDNMMFRSQAATGGVKLINVKSNLCIDVAGAEGTTNDLDQKLWLATCSDSATQVWAFV